MKIHLGKHLKCLGLREILEDRNGDLEDPNSWFRGSHYIQGVWVSDNIMFESSALLPLFIGIGDHRPIIIEVNTMRSIG